MIAAMALSAPLASHARDEGFRPESWMLAQAPHHKKKGEEPPPPRGGREMRREPPPPPRGDGRQGGRLSEEERRDLYRDLDRANREIYRPKGR